MVEIKVSGTLKLKQLTMAHANNLFQLVDKNRTFLARRLPWVNSTLNISHTETFIHNTIQDWEKHASLTLGIWHQEKLSGVISFHKFDWALKLSSMGYWLSEEKQGHGLVTQSCQKLLEYGFNALGLTTIELYCAVDNIKSQAIATNLGFEKIDLIPDRELLNGEYITHIQFVMPAERWQELTKTSCQFT